ncbi:MAG TPA: DNA translocase FtsK [Anaerohalosphaeraceae bacterium]|nr:DNA translocase FtsK [Anaerohalosphaeraceae bacterium]HQG05035.1 DNA translocase FtsK [Anaerohalosphaeraceae bacterium]HQI08181.1 DNA translocase FtsK [Anaerohalosphaeraceae bacterium]HQJ68384.1 DNA translocase FtsK [Anaerohalosphaeraceae bacterium]
MASGKPKKRTRSPKNGAENKNTNLYKLALEGMLLAFCIFLLFSLVSFDIGDAPSGYVWPHNDPVRNWCGRVGAFFAYYLMTYVGPGAVLAAAGLIAMLIVHLSGKSITQVNLRLTGLLLMTVSTSAAWFLLWPEKPFLLYRNGSFPMGNGGILGIAAGVFLRKHLAILGTALVLFSAWVVGAVLLADSVVFALTRGFGRLTLQLFGLAAPAWNAAQKHSQTLADIWTRLNEKQKKETTKLHEALRQKRTDAESAPRQAAPSEESSESRPVKLSADSDHSVEQTLAAGTPPAASKEKETEESAPAEPIKQPKRPPAKPEPYIPRTYEDYQFPPLDLLRQPEPNFTALQEKMVEQKARTLEELLDEFGIQAEVVNAEPGPAITMYELQLAPGVKVNQISNLANDIARALGSGMVRVVAPLAGRNTIGIEVPNSQREIVRIRDLIQKGGAAVSKMQIPLFLGKGSSGEVLVSDLGIMPHLLIAGTTGSGKSVCINSIIASILMTRRPDEVKLILIDPKMVEMAAFESIPHLMCPTVTEMRRAEQILQWAMEKMDERYELLAEAKVRNIASYNKLTPQELLERFQPAGPEEEAQIPKKMPHIVIVIDELADLMMTSAKEVESCIVRIAQKSRAVGIHLVLATQRPQATVVTGLIKANMPARIAFRVAARMDSRIILDQNGAEALLGQGDMLFLIPGTSDLIRAQGAFLEDDEIRNIVNFLKDVAQPQYHPELMQLNRVDMADGQRDELFDQAVRIVLESQRGSVSLLQRRLSIGYARASRIIEMMAAAGILGEYKGSQAREVTMTIEEYEEMKRNQIQEEVAQHEDLSSRTDKDESAGDSRSEEDADAEEEEEEEEYLSPTEIISEENS